MILVSACLLGVNCQYNSILNNGAKANIVYNTTNNFMDIRQIENICKKGNIKNETRN